MPSTTDTRQRIIISARDLYLRKGLPGLSMRKVAGLVGISAPAIYRHFENKAALMLAILEEGFQLFTSYLWRGLEGRNAGERLALTSIGHIRFALEQPAYYRIMFMSSAEDIGLSDITESNRARISPAFQFLVDRVRECIDAQVIGNGDAGELAAVLWANCRGLVTLQLNGELHKGPAGGMSLAKLTSMSFAKLTGIDMGHEFFKKHIDVSKEARRAAAEVTQ